MKIVYTDKHARHDPQTFVVRGVKQRSAEQPERATRLLPAAAGAQANGGDTTGYTGERRDGRREGFGVQVILSKRASDLLGYPRREPHFTPGRYEGRWKDAATTPNPTPAASRQVNGTRAVSTTAGTGSRCSRTATAADLKAQGAAHLTG